MKKRINRLNKKVPGNSAVPEIIRDALDVIFVAPPEQGEDMETAVKKALKKNMERVANDYGTTVEKVETYLKELEKSPDFQINYIMGIDFDDI